VRDALVAAGEQAVAADGYPTVEDGVINECLAFYEFPFEGDSDAGEQPFELHTELQELMETDVGITRTDEGLEEGITKLEALRDRSDDLVASGDRAYNAGMQKCFDLKNMIDVGLAIATAAKQRTESRGAHTRIDYPEPDEELGAMKFAVRLADGEFTLREEAVPEPRDELQEMIEVDQ
jgi:succinate dehydrogenase / fumarate reductase flavoprotein subunit